MTTQSLRSMWDRLERSPRADFMVTPQDRLCRGDLAELVRGMLAVFDASGLELGSRVVILTQNEIAAVSAFIAALLDGLVPVMLAQDTPEARAAAVVRSIDPGLVVTDQDRLGEGWALGPQALAVAASGSAAPRGVLSLVRPLRDGVRWGLELPEGTRAPRLPEAGDDLAYLLFTSGTTQAPSGVMLTRRNVLANLSTLSRLFACTSQTRLFNDMVLAHGDGLVQGPLLALATGGALIRSGGFTLSGIEAWLNRVRQERATHVITVPTIWAMIDRYAQHDDYFDAPECSHLVSVASRLAPGLWRRLEVRFKRPVFNQYGLTETVASALYAGPHPEMGGFGGIGVAVDCEARIAPLNADAGDEGELQLRGDNVFAGYWKDAARSAATFTPDGWMRTGDLAARLPDGSYDIRGRIKTVIMSGGLLIRPEEIDEVIAAHPAVEQSVTVALSNEDFGEIPVTAVVLCAAVDEAGLTAYARTRLEALKVPKRIIALPAIPRGDAAKPRLDELRKVLAGVIKKEAAIRDGCAKVVSFAAVSALAAEVFRIEPASLHPDSSPTAVPAWDSFSQLMLIMATEDHFGIRIPAARVAGIRSLGDLHAVIKDTRA